MQLLNLKNKPNSKCIQVAENDYLIHLKQLVYLDLPKCSDPTRSATMHFPRNRDILRTMVQPNPCSKVI